MVNTNIPDLGGLTPDREITRRFLAFSALGVYFLLIVFIVIMAYIVPFREPISDNQEYTFDKKTLDTIIAKPVNTSSTLSITNMSSGTPVAPSAQTKLGNSVQTSSKVVGKDNFDKTIQLLTTVASILGGIIGTIFGFYFKDAKD